MTDYTGMAGTKYKKNRGSSVDETSTTHTHTHKLSCGLMRTYEMAGGDVLCGHRAAGWPGVQQGHVGGEAQLTATVLTEQHRQEHSSRAVLIKGCRHALEHGVHLRENK